MLAFCGRNCAIVCQPLDQNLPNLLISILCVPLAVLLSFIVQCLIKFSFDWKCNPRKCHKKRIAFNVALFQTSSRTMGSECNDFQERQQMFRVSKRILSFMRDSWISRLKTFLSKNFRLEKFMSQNQLE